MAGSGNANGGTASNGYTSSDSMSGGGNGGTSNIGGAGGNATAGGNTAHDIMGGMAGNGGAGGAANANGGTATSGDAAVQNVSNLSQSISQRIRSKNEAD
jgi:hypothetical protein